MNKPQKKIKAQSKKMTNTNNEWFCTNCRKVFMANKDHNKCCGEVVAFDMAEHGRQLIGLSNAWIAVWSTWREHPLMLEAEREVIESGNSGAAMVLNLFIRKLLDNHHI